MLINDLIEKEDIKIENMIYEIRGKQVMLDSDLAKLYKCKNGTKTINLAVKRHINRFPERFMFRLTEEEARMFSRSQLGTLKGRGHNVKYLPYAFTEQGVAMLATILRTPVAEEVSIRIMDAFVAMRKYIGSNLIEQKYINHLVLEHEDKIKLLETSFEKLETKKNEIYFNGQIYDAYSKILDILSEAKEEIIIIDGYADKSVLDMIRNPKVKVILIIKNCGNLKEQDILKYQEQYDNLHLIYDISFHARYIILDKKVFYHCGASLNHAGSKTFSINTLEDEIVKRSLLEKIGILKEFI